MPTSVGGRAKINQPPPGSTESRPSTSLKKVRSASGSRLKIITCAPEMSPLMASVYGQARPVFTVACQQASPPAANKNSIDLDRVPSLRKDDRTREPLGRLRRAQLQPREPVQATHEEAAQVGHEGADAWFIREALETEFVGFHEGRLDEVAVALFEPAQGSGAITDARGVNAE